MRTALTLAAASLLFSTTARAQKPEIAMQVVEMSPASPAVLHRNEYLYLHIHYASTVPVRIEVEYRHGGTRVSGNERESAAVLLDAGEADTLAWVVFNSDTAVDTIHLSSRAGNDGVFAAADVSVDYHWDGQASSGETRAKWVGPLLRTQQAQERAAFAEMETRARNPGSGGIGAVTMGIGLIFVAVAGAIMLAAFAWPVWGVVRWSGGWRVAAAAPIAAVVLWAIKDAVDLVRDPTSHNLLPFEFIIAAFCIVPYMLVVAIWRRQRRKRSNG